MGQFKRKFQTTGGVDHQLLFASENWAISWGIKISSLHCLALSQSMRVTDGQTDGQTEILH